MIPVFYDDRMLALPRHGASTELSTIVRDWLTYFAGYVRIHPVAPATSEELASALTRRDAEPELGANEGRRVGSLESDAPHLLSWTVGSILSAARFAAKAGRQMGGNVACAPISAVVQVDQEACFGQPPINGLVAAARAVINDGLAKSVAIIDCDVHSGNTTDEFLNAHPGPEDIINLVIGRESTNQPGKESDHLAFSLSRALITARKRDLVLYQPCADTPSPDSHEGILVNAGFRSRDAMVFRTQQQYDFPLVWSLACLHPKGPDGGIRSAVKLHRQTMAECIKFANLL